MKTSAAQTASQTCLIHAVFPLQSFSSCSGFRLSEKEKETIDQHRQIAAVHSELSAPSIFCSLRAAVTQPEHRDMNPSP